MSILNVIWEILREQKLNGAARCFWGSPRLVDSGLGPGALGRFLTFKAFFLGCEIP